MKKEITIGNVSIPVQASAFTPFAYRNQTGRELLEDLMEMQTSIEQIQADENSAPRLVSSLLSKILELAYVMNAEADSSVKDFKTWLKQFEGILETNEWLAEVVSVAASTFRRSN